jgi:hypothetical protein
VPVKLQTRRASGRKRAYTDVALENGSIRADHTVREDTFVPREVSSPRTTFDVPVSILKWDDVVKSDRLIATGMAPCSVGIIQC